MPVISQQPQLQDLENLRKRPRVQYRPAGTGQARHVKESVTQRGLQAQSLWVHEAEVLRQHVLKKMELLSLDVRDEIVCRVVTNSALLLHAAGFAPDDIGPFDVLSHSSDSMTTTFLQVESKLLKTRCGRRCPPKIIQMSDMVSLPWL